MKKQEGIAPQKVVNLAINETYSQHRTESELSARTALEGLTALGSVQRLDLDNATVSEFVRRGFAEEAGKEIVLGWQRAIVEAAHAQKQLPTAQQRVREYQAVYSQAKERAESTWHYIKTFSWLGGTAQQEARETADRAAIPLQESTRKLEIIRENIKAGTESDMEKRSYAEVNGRYLKLTNAGEELRADLQARSALLTGVNLDTFCESNAAVRSLMEWRVERAQTLTTLFKEVGFKSEQSEVLNNVFVLSTLNQPLETVLERAASIDQELSIYKLQQGQRLNIVSLLMSSEKGIVTKDRLGEVASTVQQSLGSKGIGYQELYIAAHLLEKYDSRADLVEHFVRIHGDLQELKIGTKSGLSIHIAARLATEPQESFIRFRELFNQLPIKDLEAKALCALSLQRLAIPQDRLIERLQNTKTLLSEYGLSNGSTADMPIIAAIAAYPGIVEPRVKLLSDISKLLLKDRRFKEGILAKSFVIFGGIVKELASPETMARAGEQDLLKLENCGIERSVQSPQGSSNFGNTSSSTSYGTTGSSGDSFYIYHSCPAHHWGIFDSCPAGGLHDLGASGGHGALCGGHTHDTSSHNHSDHQHSDGQHCDNTSHYHCDGGGHETSSTPASNCSAASNCSSAASCSSAPSCGGGGCGGGGD